MIPRLWGTFLGEHPGNEFVCVHMPARACEANVSVEFPALKSRFSAFLDAREMRFIAGTMTEWSGTVVVSARVFLNCIFIH